MAKKRKKTRFVPPMILGSAVLAGVVPAISATACSSSSQQFAVGVGFVVAAIFDASADAPDANGFVVAAAFDAGPDANGFVVAAAFDASPDADGNGGHDSGEG